MSKILFLDFDGVINSDEGPHGDEVPRQWFAFPLVQRLNEIIRETGARVVISSDWRHGRSIAQLQDLLENHGFAFPEAIIDKTGDHSDKFPHTDQFGLEKARAWEIRDWLEAHPEVTDWVCVDDLDIPVDPAHMAQTDHKVGLTDADAERAIQILGRKPEDDSSTFLMPA